MKKTDEQIMNKIILHLYNHRQPQNITFLLSNYGIEKNDFRRIKELMSAHGLIHILSANQNLTVGNNLVKITDYGIKILAEHGDYISYLKSLKTTNLWIKFTSRWLPIMTFIFTIGSFCLGYSLNKHTKYENEIIKQQDKTIELLGRLLKLKTH